jgi:hypothetical protein
LIGPVLTPAKSIDPSVMNLEAAEGVSTSTQTKKPVITGNMGKFSFSSVIALSFGLGRAIGYTFIYALKIPHSRPIP